MKTQTQRTISILAVVAALSAGAYPLWGQDGEAQEEKESIRRIVDEAQRVASEWAVKIREMRSGEEKPSTYVGIVIDTVPDVLRDYVDLPKGVGLLLSRIVKDGPAAKAGLEDNDILVEFDNQMIVNYSQLSTLIDLKGPGATVPVKIIRKGEKMTFELTLEERMRKGMQFIAPQPPGAPPAPPPIPHLEDLPDVGDVGAIMERVEEWIPGSVRVWIDEKEQVHVDLRDLKENLEQLKTKMQHIHVLEGDGADNLVLEHGDLGARTTVVRVEDKNMTYSNKEGKLVLNSTGSGQHAMVWDADGELVYEGAVPADYQKKLPALAVKLIDALKASRENLKLDQKGDKLEIHLNREDIDPVTVLLR